MTIILPSNARMATDSFICDIGPDLAVEWLKRNDNNRNISPANARKIIKAMDLNEFRLNHQSIAFDTNGKLLDGQHRLWAIVKTGKTVTVRVTLNCEPESINTVDVGKSRTHADLFSLDGHVSVKQKAAIVKQLLAYKHFPGNPWNYKEVVFTAVTAQKALEQVDQFCDFDYVIKYSTSCYNQNKHLLTTACSTFYILALRHGKAKETIESYLQQVATGLNINSDDITYRLRRKWQYAKKDEYTHTNKSQKRLSELIECFYYFERGIKKEKFPSFNWLPMRQFR